jgi:GWxTD domain-containing protein
MIFPLKSTTPRHGGPLRQPRVAARAACMLLAALGLILPPLSAAAQELDLSTYPEVEVSDLPAGYRQWLEEQVAWIITARERDVYLRLQTDAQRDLFIENFWKARDPSPDTRRNEYRELHYDRFDYANRALGGETNTPGSLTDRGRAWILLGEPSNRSPVGGGMQLVPAEVWFYTVDPSLGVAPQFYLVFFRDADFGEYRLWSPSVDGTERLLTLAARQRLGQVDLGELDPRLVVELGTQAASALVAIKGADLLLADAAESLVPGQRNERVARGERLLSSLGNVGEVLMPRTEWADRVLTGDTESTVRFETLPMAAEAAIIMGTEYGTNIHLSVLAGGERVEILEAEGRNFVGLELAASFRDAQGEALLLSTPQVIDAPLNEQQAAMLADREFQYLWRREFPAEATTLDIDLASTGTGEFGRATLDLRSTAPADSGIEAYRPFLVREVQNLAESLPPAPLPFQLGEILIMPALDGPFVTGSAAPVYWQIRIATDSPPAIQANFELRDAAGSLIGDWASPIQVAEAPGFVNHLVPVPLTDVPPGRYVLECRLDLGDGSSGRTVRLPLRVVPEGGAQPPIVYARPSAPREIVR